MKALKKSVSTIFMLLTIIAAHANQPNIIGFCSNPVYEISVVSATKGTQSTTLHYIVSTNNTNELLLKTDDLDTEDLMYLIQNSEGRVLKSSRIENNQITINVTNLVSGTCFLVVSNDQESKTFKIVKKIETDGVVAMGK